MTTISVPADEAVFGWVNIAASGAIFNASTDDLSAGHITDLYTDAAIATQNLQAAAGTPAAAKSTAVVFKTSQS